jgi:starch-binding outer membrane protein, SusD/RagB family
MVELLSIKQVKSNVMKSKYILAVLLSIFLLGCSDDFLDVELKNDLGVDSYYKNKEHALAAITSCYDPLKGRGMFGNTYQYVLFALDDRMINENASLNEFNFTANSTFIGGDPLNFSIWDYLYRGLFRTNLALRHVPGIDINEEDPAGFPLKERLFAEARFMRSVYNFYLVMHFNQPVFLDFPAYDLAANYTNSPPSRFWDQIETDLTYSIQHLPEQSQYASKDLGRATKGAAKALLGKSYLFQQRWAEAESVLNQVITSGQYKLSMPKGNDSIDYVNAYLANFTAYDLPASDGSNYRSEWNSESIFEINYANSNENIINEWNPGFQTDGSNFSRYFGVNGFRNVVPKAEMAEVYEITPEGHPTVKDPRFSASLFKRDDVMDALNPQNTSFYNRPFRPRVHTNASIDQGYGLKKNVYPVHNDPVYGVGNDPNNWRLIRYADVLLMYAEACYHTGNTDAGLNALNQVRQRVGLPDRDALTPAYIIHERDVELFGECLRYPDMVRWLMLPTPWVTPEQIHPNFQTGQHEFFPIPEVEVVRLGGSLQQNPGW